MNQKGSYRAVRLDFQPVEGQVIQKKVAVLGHSFVRDLPLPTGNLLDNNSNTRVLNRKVFVPGATVASMQISRVWDRFLNFKPDLTFLLIGGNDITPQSLPADIARSIISLGKKVKEETGVGGGGWGGSEDHHSRKATGTP